MNKDKLEPRVWFPGWAEALAQEPWPPARREASRRVIVWDLHECKERGWPVSVASARRFMAMVEQERQPAAERLAAWKEGLNWFFRRAMQAGRGGAGATGGSTSAEAGVPNGPVMRDVPTLGRADLGQTDWEQRLVRRVSAGRMTRRRNSPVWHGTSVSRCPKS